MLINNESLELAEMVGNWFKKEVAPVCLQYDASNEFPKELYEGMVALGLNAMDVPEEFGGLGLSCIDQTLIAEQIGKYEAGLGSAVGVNNSVVHLIRKFGNKDQKERFFNLLLQGEWSGFCLTEPNAGSDASAISTKYEIQGDEYVLNGTKCFITNGGIAGAYVVFATANKELGLKGISCFLVERERDGVQVGKEEDKMGIRLSNTTEMIFKDVRIPKENLIGKEGEGFKIAMSTLNESRINVGAMGVGLAARALEEAVEYAKTRVQFNKPIANLQSIQAILADIAMEVEAARQLVYHTAELVDAKLPYSKYSSMSKCKGSDIAMKAAVEALQVFGGYGFMKEYPMEKLVRDAKILQIYEGTNEVQRTIIAKELLK